jgi:hypothetical protein
MRILIHALRENAGGRHERDRAQEDDGAGDGSHAAQTSVVLVTP